MQDLNNKKEKERLIFYETFQIVISLIIVALGVTVFIAPEKNKLAFPAIFTLSSTLNASLAAKHLSMGFGKKKYMILGIWNGIAAVFLLAMSIIASISL